MLRTLSLELLVSAAVYLVTGFLERRLNDRKLSWTYLFERLI
jgi:hypothetical protein